MKVQGRLIVLDEQHRRTGVLGWDMVSIAPNWRMVDDIPLCGIRGSVYLRQINKESGLK